MYFQSPMSARGNKISRVAVVLSAVALGWCGGCVNAPETKESHDLRWRWMRQQARDMREAAEEVTFQPYVKQ